MLPTRKYPSRLQNKIRIFLLLLSLIFFLFLRNLVSSRSCLDDFVALGLCLCMHSVCASHVFAVPFPFFFFVRYFFSSSFIVMSVSIAFCCPTANVCWHVYLYSSVLSHLWRVCCSGMQQHLSSVSAVENCILTAFYFICF